MVRYLAEWPDNIFTSSAQKVSAVCIYTSLYFLSRLCNDNVKEI